MTKIVVFGGTGYAGAGIVAEAAARGHEVVAVSRTNPNVSIDGVQYLSGSALDAHVRSEAMRGADVVVLALSPRGDMAGKVGELYLTIANEVASLGARLFVIGGFGSLRPAEGGARFVDSDAFPADYRPESLELASVLDGLQSNTPDNLDWLYISPAQEFGGFNPGEKTGSYRVNGDVAVFDKDGRSQLSGLDLALAVVDEIETPAHHRQHISISY